MFFPVSAAAKKSILRRKDMKNFSSKKALFLSVISMVICVSMLIGSTFAWFTDSATASVNTIQAGNLEVELVDKDGKTLTEALKWVKSAEAPEGEKVLWEPGCKYNLEPFAIKNSGNLALKYKVVISGLTGDATLLEAIDFTVSVDGDALVAKDEESTATTVASLNNFEGTLEAGKTTGLITITGKMKETAGNKYKGLSLENISITVYASQLNSESDSTGKDYDEDATYYPVIDAAGLKDALKTGGNIRVDANLAPKVAMVAEKDTTLNMNGKTIANTADVWEAEPNSWSLVSARAGATLTIDGNGTFKAKENDCFAVDIQDGGKLVIKNGTFIGNIHAVYVLSGEAVIEGGFFSVQQKYPDAAKADEFVLNCYDANRANGTAKTGFCIMSFPAENAEGITVTKELYSAQMPSGSSITFTFRLEKATEVNFIPQWGTSARSEAPDIEDGKTISIGSQSGSGNRTATPVTTEPTTTTTTPTVTEPVTTVPVVTEPVTTTEPVTQEPVTTVPTVTEPVTTTTASTTEAQTTVGE